MLEKVIHDNVNKPSSLYIYICIELYNHFFGIKINCRLLSQCILVKLYMVDDKD